MPSFCPFGPCYQQPTYSWSSSGSYYGPPYPGAIAPPPPPPYSPYGYPIPGPYSIFGDDSDAEDKRYKKHDVKCIKVHVITVPPHASASSLFSGRSIHPSFVGHRLPVSMSISEFFKAVGAFKDEKAMIEEAVEEGNGRWSRGAKLYWGCQEPTSLKVVRWRRGCGLRTASEQVVWVIIRRKTADDE